MHPVEKLEKKAVAQIRISFAELNDRAVVAKYYREITASVATLTVEPADSNSLVLSWGVVFLGEGGSKLCSIYFDDSGERGFVNSTAVRFSSEHKLLGLFGTPSLISWIKTNFSAVLGQ